RELSDGLRELDDNSDKLRDAADELLHEYLVQANGTISLLGGERLTEENYSDELEKLIAKNDDYAEDLTELRDSLDGLVQFRDGIGEYTDGVLEARNGSVELANGMDDLDSETVKLLDEVFDIDIDNLTSFVTAEDNIRIGAAAGDVIMDKNAGLVAGVIILVLFAYVISVFVVHQIEREQSVIGALYALGVRKKDLLWHYITLPTIVAFVGGLIGAALGFSPIGIGTQTADTYGYFSVPEFDVVYPVYLIVYAVVLPPVICAAVNALVINKKLSQTALSLIKNEQSAGSYKQVRLRTKSFTRLFAIRQLMRESRSAITVTLGMLVSLLVVMLGLDCYVMCNAVNRNTIADTHYEYMYLYKYPEEKAPGGEQAYIETLSTDCMGYTLDVTVIGLDGESKYFSARPEKGRSKAVINNSLVERYGYKVGDRVTFTDEAADTDYSFTVTGVCDYSPGFTIFMDIESMRELFGKEEDYFNAVYSDEELDIDEGRLYSVTTKADVEKSAGVFIEQMSSLIIVLMAAGAIIFCVVMYLMLGVMIDRSAMGISLIKIFGYRPNEIRQLYLNGNLAVIAVGGLITIPLAKLSMDAIYPSFIPNVACSMKLEFPWYL
ncbi:MAG: ABC transporter permease, partial [Ruminococcus sp.]|nr:ABC transporter permease [Ruminococcus sp.]